MIALILIAGLILRLFKLDQSLWLDEAINVTFVKNLNLHSLIFDYSVGDFHPPLYHIMMRGWVLLFGTSEIAVRLPSVILGLATVYVVYFRLFRLFFCFYCQKGNVNILVWICSFNCPNALF